MSRWLASLLLLIVMTPLSGQNLICLSENVACYYSLEKVEERDSVDIWQVQLDIRNESTGDLFYERMNNNILQEGHQLIPSYLKVKVPNALRPPNVTIYDMATYLANDGSIYVHGISTLKMGRNNSTLFKIQPVRIQPAFHAWLPKGERPMLEGEFMANLQPLENLAKKKRKD